MAKPAAASSRSTTSERPFRTSFEVAGDPHAISTVRSKVSGAMQAAGVTDLVHDDAELLVTELMSNVVRHQDAGAMSVDVSIAVDGSATVSVTGGIGELSAALVRPPALPAQSSEGGRGLFIVDSVASTWGTQRKDGRTTVWFTLDDDRAVDDSSETSAAHGTATEDAIVAAAAAVMVQAEAVAAATVVQLTADPDAAANRAAATAERAALDAAERTAIAASHARAAAAAAATAAARAVSAAAARAVIAVQAHADAIASAVAAAADEAATAASMSIAPGGDAAAARTAREVAAKVISTADVAAAETARAALLVARAVADTAAAVASTTLDAAAALQRDVLDTAAAVRSVTRSTARELAADTIERRAAMTLAARDVLAASDATSERLHAANRELRRAGLHDRVVAVALQEAMLSRLPETQDLLLAARYLTAAHEDQIGGDWYDALVLTTGTTSLVIGDVIGHDIAAAATMGQLRNILRALIWDRNEAPASVVARLDHAIRELHIDTIATMVLVNVEPPLESEPLSVATLRWANAGHPAPVLIDAEGNAIALDGRNDILLGVEPNAVRHDHAYSVPPGATLLLYTDGLVETRTDSIDSGQRRLLDSVRAHYQLDPGDLLDAVITDMVADHPADDVAVLAARFGHFAGAS